jgi:hypothetical protein
MIDVSKVDDIYDIFKKREIECISRFLKRITNEIETDFKDIMVGTFDEENSDSKFFSLKLLIDNYNNDKYISNSSLSSSSSSPKSYSSIFPSSSSKSLSNHKSLSDSSSDCDDSRYATQYNMEMYDGERWVVRQVSYSSQDAIYDQTCSSMHNSNPCKDFIYVLNVCICVCVCLCV